MSDCFIRPLSSETDIDDILRIESISFTNPWTREMYLSELEHRDVSFFYIARDAVGEAIADDPSMTNIMGPYTAAFNDYVRTELNYESDIPYEILSFKAHEQWSYAEHQNRFVEVAETLRRAIHQDFDAVRIREHAAAFSRDQHAQRLRAVIDETMAAPDGWRW